jgi:hypothetical protein
MSDFLHDYEREMRLFADDFRLPPPEKEPAPVTPDPVSLLDFEYPVGIKCYPPAGFRHDWRVGKGEEMGYPSVSAMNADHARMIATAWLVFWQTAAPAHAWRLRLRREDPPGWLRVDIVES